MKTMRRWIAILCALALICSLGSVAYAAEDLTATLLRMERAEGTVYITNSAGRSLTTSDGMRLMNGYTISTDAASYAYISLDSTKAIQLDSLTTCTVRQQGNQLELLVEEGMVFFHVTAPVAANASLTIRTSTMATGIRGTAGVVWSNHNIDSGTRLYTGQVTITTATAPEDTYLLTASQQAITHFGDQGEDDVFTINGTTPADYTGFELTAIANDAALMEELFQNGNSPITSNLLSNASNLLTQDQAAQQEKVDTAQWAQDTQTAQDGATEATVSTSSTSSGGSSSNGGSSSSSDTTTDDTTTTTVTVSDYDALVTALSDGETDIVVDSDITCGR